MREFLFRGKRKDSVDEWLFGNLIHQLDYYGEPCDDMYIAEKNDCWENDVGTPIEVRKETVGQFTGIINKKGVKVFEHDIVEITDHTMEEIFEKCGEMVKQFLTRTFLVFWNETKWSIKSLEPEFIPNPPIFDLPVENVTYEVIGNIHTR
jgi:hypothetical protein